MDFFESIWRKTLEVSAQGSFIHEGQKWVFTRGNGAVREQKWVQALGPLAELPCHIGPSTLASGTSLNPLHNFSFTCESHLPFCRFSGIIEDPEFDAFHRKVAEEILYIPCQ